VENSEFKQLAEEALNDLKATDIVALDVKGFASITDYMLIASGRSNRHVRSIADSVIEKAKEVGQPVLGVEGREYGEWVLVDLGDVVVHVMQPRARDFYKLENLWDMGDKSGRPTDAGQAS